MIQNFKSEKELTDWVDDRMRETQTTRQAWAQYANKCRAYFNGTHWLKSGTGPDGLMRLYYNEMNTWLGEYDANEPMRVTINQITKHVLQSAASTNWTEMEVTAAQSHGSPSPDDVVNADLIEAVANVAIDQCRLRAAAETANFERCVDAMHGVGVRLQSCDLNGQRDYDLRAFDFDGYQLCLDPTLKDHDLRAHPYVIYTEVLTLHAAERDFGPEIMAKIDKDKLQTVAQLLPVELAFHGLSGGRMYSHLSQVSSQKAVRAHWVFLRGPGKRFDRLYYVIDGIGPAGRSVVNFGNPANPYGGCGMPLAIKVGFRRPGEIFPISDVGMMIDEQDRLNAIASLFFQQMWDYTTNYVYLIDKGWFGDSRADTSKIQEMTRGTHWIGNTNGQTRFQPPQLVSRPAPSQGLEMSMERARSEVRRANFQSDLHDGQTKTHVADRTNQLAVELVEMPIDDRRDADVMAVAALIEVAAGTLLRAAQSGGVTLLLALKEAGLNQTLIGRALSLNPDRLPAKLVINRESVRRRSRGQQKRDLIEAVQYGAHLDPTIRQALSELDYPLMQDDKAIERWANEAVARLITGDMWDAIPFGSSRETVFSALRRGMMSDAAKNPQVMAALQEAFQMQMEIEGMLAPPEEGASPQQQGPVEMTLEDMLGGIDVPV